MTLHIDPQTTMASEVEDDILTIVYPHPDFPSTRQKASVVARQYGRDRGRKAQFADHVIEGHVQTFTYWLVPK